MREEYPCPSRSRCREGAGRRARAFLRGASKWSTRNVSRGRRPFQPPFMRCHGRAGKSAHRERRRGDEEGPKGGWGDKEGAINSQTIEGTGVARSAARRTMPTRDSNIRLRLRADQLPVTRPKTNRIYKPATTSDMSVPYRRKTRVTARTKCGKHLAQGRKFPLFSTPSEIFILRAQPISQSQVPSPRITESSWPRSSEAKRDNRRISHCWIGYVSTFQSLASAKITRDPSSMELALSA